MCVCEGGTPKVSVIVVTYNQDDTIARTLDSILEQQTDFPFEIELADDCSTDRTPDVCRAYAAQFPDRIRYTRNKTNLGVRENYFGALRRCRAEYIADCAGDDYWVDPYKLQKQADLLDAHPEVGLVHTGWRYVNEATGRISAPDASNDAYLRPFAQPGELLEAVMVQRMLIHWCTALYRKSIFLRAEREHPYPFLSPEITIEDFQLSMVYAHDAVVAYLPDITLHYTVGHRSVTNNTPLWNEADFVLTLARLKRYFATAYGIRPEFMRSVYDRLARFLVSITFIIRDRVRLEAVLRFFNDNGIRMPFNCRVMSVISRYPYLWRVAAAVKKAHHEWLMKKWS